MELYNKGYVNGEPVYGEEYTTDEIAAQLYASKEWTDFTARFAWPNDYNKDLFDLVIEEKLGPNPELADYQSLFKNVIAAGGIVRLNNGQQYEFQTVPEPEVIVEPEVPTDRNGRPLSASQLAWGEMTRWSQTASSRQIEDRRRIDPAFASFYHKNLERESAGGVGDAVENLNQRQQVSASPAEELVAFAAEYHKTPTEKLRQLKRFDTNPYGAAKWNQMFEACVSAGLI